LLNASVGVQRVIGRLRRPQSPRALSASSLRHRSLAVVRHVDDGVHSALAATRLVPAHRSRPAKSATAAPAERPARRSLVGRIGHDRVLAGAVAAIVVAASVISVSAGRLAAPAAPAVANGPVGGPTGDGPEPRIVVGGGINSEAQGPTGDVEFADPEPADGPGPEYASIDFGDESIEPEAPVSVEGPFIDDGTLVKPIAVDTTVPDGADLVKTYKVKSGDTLAKIAESFQVSTMSVVWANDLKGKDDLKNGQTLSIPPVTGLIIQVAATDTLDSLATHYGVNRTDILATNGIDDPNLVVGQVLVIPGAKGQPIPQKPSKPITRPTTRPSSGGTVRPPSTYRGGSFLWPVMGGNNYISQYFHYGHYGLDIAADYGTRVRAAAAGTVIFAGWKSNGGGYQVWVAHGSGLYTTYNHMSAVSVGRGQHVSRGQQVGRVGQSGYATGPHLHFEVWRGPVWDGGRRVNPLGYL
jgi:murein DD-endopeptidase MepM/ murein hydrolase activator NlpD